MLEKQTCSLTVLPTTDAWYGMTYKEDVPIVQAAFRRLLESGVYRADLFSDL